jgi:hypothetical protein
MNGYEWLPKPELVVVECDECGHVTYREPEQPRFGPETLSSWQFRENIKSIYSDLDLSSLIPEFQLRGIIKT